MKKIDRSPQIISIASGKGGTGKTLLLASLGYALDQAGHNVLLVDFDLATEGLSHFVLGSDGVSRLATFRDENTVSGFLREALHETQRPPTPLARTVNRGSDQEIIYNAIISGRGLYGDNVPEFIVDDTGGEKGTKKSREALRAFFEELPKVHVPGEPERQFDYILVDTRGGFGLLTTLVCALSDYFILVTEPTTASLYQNRKLYDRILEEAEQNNLQPVIRGAIVNKAVRNIEPVTSKNGGAMQFDADRIEQRFRSDLAQSLGITIDRTFGIPSDLAAVETYAFQNIPFSHAPGSLFALTTIDAFSGLMETVTVEWPKERLKRWNALVHRMRQATIDIYNAVKEAQAEELKRQLDELSEKLSKEKSIEVSEARKEEGLAAKQTMEQQKATYALRVRRTRLTTWVGTLIVTVTAGYFLLTSGLLPDNILQLLSTIGGGAVFAD